MQLHYACLSVGIFLLGIAMEPGATNLLGLSNSTTTDSNCSYTVKMCDADSVKPGCPPCYSCFCTPIVDPRIERKTIYSKYLPRIRGQVNETQGDQNVIPEPLHKEDAVNYAYDDFLRAVANKQLRLRHRRSADEKCSYSFQKCHPENTKSQCSHCHKCVCRPIQEVVANDTNAGDDPFVAFILPKKNLNFPQEEDDRVLGLEFPRARNLEDFKVFVKLLLESGHASAVPLLKLMKNVVRSDVDHNNYENPNYYRPFPETNDGIIRTKDHVYNLANVPSASQKDSGKARPTTVTPQKRYQLYDRGFRLIRPILDIMDRRNRMLGTGHQMTNETTTRRRNGGGRPRKGAHRIARA